MLVTIWPLPDITAPLERFWLFFLFSSLFSVGMMLNFYVLYRMLRLANKDSNQFLHGTGVFLTIMASSDLVGQTAVFIQMLAAFSFDAEVPDFVFNGLCRITESLIRVGFSLSMYSWLCMSALRYIAAMRPLAYATLGLGPLALTIGVGVLSLMTNLHLFVSVKSSSSCQLLVEATSTIYCFTDTLFSFVVPFIVIVWLDIKVLCCRSRERQCDPLLNVVFHKVDDEIAKRKAFAMRRFMCVTLVSLIFCFPESVVRVLLVSTPRIMMHIPPYWIHAAKTLYFIKFSFNAFYLTAFVFDRNVASKTSSSRQLSISLRRLEDTPSIVPRGRSQTVSYRSPSPTLAQSPRKTSCIDLPAITICLDSV